MSDTFKLTISIQLGNDAMQTEDDIMDAVKSYIERCENNRGFPREAMIVDRNGNQVGTARVYGD